MPLTLVPRSAGVEDPVLAAWATSCRVTELLVENVPPALWRAPIPGLRARTVRSIAAHIHNTRCGWIKTLGSEHGITSPERVDRRTVTPRRLVSALKRSGRGIAAVLELGASHGGKVPPSKGYVWRNLALDVEHVLTYFVAHEGHHRGQIVMIARQLGHPLPPSVLGGLWRWKANGK